MKSPHFPLFILMLGDEEKYENEVKLDLLIVIGHLKGVFNLKNSFVVNFFFLGGGTTKIMNILVNAFV